MKERAEGINFIRICCMVTILLFHTKIHYGMSTGITILDEFISIGAVAIVGFFMMSGFCLRKQYRGINIIESRKFGDYIKKRLIGIYPIFFFLLVCTFVFNYRLGVKWLDTLRMLPIELSLLHVTVNPLLNEYFFNDNFWYISTLFILYLLFPYCNQIADSINRKKRWIICIILTIISWYIYYLNIYSPPGNAFLFYYTNPLFRIPEFFVGMLASDIVDEESVMIKWWQVAGGTVLVGIVIHCVYPYWRTCYNLYNIAIIPYFFLLLLAGGAMRKKTKLAIIAQSVPVRYVTSLGLTIYLAQSISIMVLEKNLLSLSYNANVIFIIMTILFAILLHEIIEKPSKNVFHIIGRRKTNEEK